MIIIKLWGGLGNQMFQYAYAYQLAKRINTDIIIDTSWFASQNARKPDLLNFNIKYNKVINLAETNKHIRFWNEKMQNRLLRIPKYACYHIGGLNYLKETRYRYNPEIGQYYKDNTYIDGYWQCPRYFEHELKDLQTQFVPINIRSQVASLGKELKKIESVAIHIRRGDYPSHRLPFIRLKTIGDEYYISAINQMEKQSDKQYFLFSNDLNEAEKVLIPYINKKLRVLTKEISISMIEEWYLMMCCRHHIIGNSTFSWWAAFLNDNENKIVYAPSKYMGNDDIIPDSWIKITD